MKLLKDGRMYVEAYDIQFLVSIPRIVSDEIVFDSMLQDEIIEFSGKEAISFWKSKKEIVDYSIVKGLSDNQIGERINELNEEINRLSDKVVVQPSGFLRFFEKENDFGIKIKNFNHIKETLERYLKDREKYDLLFNV